MLAKCCSPISQKTTILGPPKEPESKKPRAPGTDSRAGAPDTHALTLTTATVAGNPFERDVHPADETTHHGFLSRPSSPASPKTRKQSPVYHHID